MNYIYHWVPENMQGDILYPLNILKEKYPDLYQKEASKYTGREHIMQQQIPFLDCLWNDVLHFSPVHPSVVKENLMDAGRTKPFDMNFFKINPHLLNPANTIVYLNRHKDMRDRLKEDNFAQYNPDDIAQYSEIRDETTRYYKEMYSQGKSPLLFHGVVHILYKGPLDTKGVPRIKP